MILSLHSDCLRKYSPLVGTMLMTPPVDRLSRMEHEHDPQVAMTGTGRLTMSGH